MKKPTAWLAVLGLIVGSACATRLARPYVKGTVYDQRTNLPLKGVQVRTSAGIESVTDDKGRFELQPRTYREVAFPGGEGPAVLLLFWLSKPGYKEEQVQRIDTRGGSGSPRVPWVLERLELRPK